MDKKKKKGADKKPEKKPKSLRDLPRRSVLSAEVARNVKGGDEPPPITPPGSLPPPP